MSNKKLNVAVIGCGSISKLHIEGASTIAVCCATMESAKLGQPVQIVYPEP
jgi:hypothetical protein